jgi:hypothetical protein
MPFELASIIRLRPRLYHLTATANANRIRSNQRIDSASRLFQQAGLQGETAQRRPSGKWIQCDGDAVHIRDQAPLHRGNIELQDGWDFERLVTHLNNHVFFWPGGVDGPIVYGIRHFQRYASDDAVVLVLNTREVLEANPFSGPFFCQYNSGSPRCSGGQRSPRGPKTFQSSQTFPHSPGQVIEVTFRDTVSLRGCEVIQRRTADFLGA